MKKLEKQQYENFINEILPSPWKFRWYKSLGTPDVLGQVVVGGINNTHEMRIIYGVQSHEDLTRTILHQLAHIYVDMNQEHGSKFNHVYESLIQINWTFIHQVKKETIK